MFELINTDNELSNFDIIKIIEDMKLTHVFGGVYSKDQLPTELIREKLYIVIQKIVIETTAVRTGPYFTTINS